MEEDLEDFLNAHGTAFSVDVRKHLYVDRSAMNSFLIELDCPYAIDYFKEIVYFADEGSAIGFKMTTGVLI